MHSPHEIALLQLQCYACVELSHILVENLCCATAAAGYRVARWVSKKVDMKIKKSLHKSTTRQKKVYTKVYHNDFATEAQFCVKAAFS